MSDDKRARLKDWLASGEASLHPATLPQRELWETSPVPAADACNNICTITTVRGPVSRELCRRAMELVVDRQEVLRLSVLPGKNGPVQLVRRSTPPSIHLHDLPGAESDDQVLDDYITALVRTPFDLVAGPLYRFHVVRRSPEHHLLVLVIHHAIGDGWTLGVFMTDLFTAYAQLVLGVTGSLAAVPQTYTAWGAAERAFWTPTLIAERSNFWTDHLADAPRPWAARQPTGPSKIQLERLDTSLPADLITRLRTLAGRAGATLFTTTLTAFQAVLHRATGSPDTLVGTPVANRSRSSSRETMGSYAGIVPVRTTIDPSLPFTDQLAATHETTLACFANALPFAELVPLLGNPVTPGTNPVFDTRFALQNHPMPDISMAGLDIDYRTRSTGTARFDLACELTEIGGETEVVWLFRNDMFSLLDVNQLHHHFVSALETATSAPATPLSSLIGPTP